MKWQCKRQERIDKKANWHDFFCIVPERVNTDNRTYVWVWLETIERKGTTDWWCGWSFEYRLKNK